MERDAAPGGALYAEYRAEIEGDPLVRALLRAVVVLFVVNTVFILVDWLVYPDKFASFLKVRIGLDLTLALIYAWSAERFPLASTFATCFAGGAMLFAVVFGTGGASSEYYVGLVLLFIGTGVLVPLSARQGVLAIGTLFALYVAVTLVSGDDAPWRHSALSLFFLAAAMFIGSMSCAYLDRMRFLEFRQRREIERTRDQLKELDREKSRFTANVHHELRTPLTLTLAPLEAMLEGAFGEVSELQRGYLETMRSNSQRLLKLINNLLDLAKIEGNKLEVRRRPVRVQRIITDLVNGARPLAERKGVIFETHALADLPEVNVDPDALEKIVMNLVGNALKFTDRGGRIEVFGDADDAGGIHFVVADTGVGLPEDQLDRIFDRFAQVDSSSTRQYGGTGIGLSLVQELVSLHEGRIWAESEGVGCGTQIHVSLPPGEVDVEEEEAAVEMTADPSVRASSLAEIESELEAAQSDSEGVSMAEMRRSVEAHEAGEAIGKASVELPEHPPGTPEILVVDDNAGMRRLLTFLLGQEYRIRQAHNGRVAIEELERELPDLVITDVMMPEMSGTELCSAIRAEPKWSHLPVMLVTSKAEREMKVKGLELGADDYVTKPFHPRELMARTRALIRVQVLQDELSMRNRLLESTNEELQETLLELKEAGSQLVQAERLAAVGELAAGVAHEVNNPVNFALNSMRALRVEVEHVEEVVASLARLDWDDPRLLEEQLAQLRKIREELDWDDVSGSLNELASIVTEGLERTSRLVGDLRDFAAPSEGTRADLDVGRGIESTIHLVQHQLREAEVDLVLDIEPDLPRIVGDAGALNQVFLNLVKNSTEALEGGGGTIWVTARVEEGAVRVEVRDDGPGIAPEHRDAIFEPFYTTKHAGAGTGLGLSMSRRIVMQHDGSLDLDPPPDGGSAFVVRLPLSGATATAAADAARGDDLAS